MSEESPLRCGVTALLARTHWSATARTLVGAASIALLPALPHQSGGEGEGAAPSYRGGSEHTGYYPGGLAGRGPGGAESVLFAAVHPFTPGPGSAQVPAMLVAVSGQDGTHLWRRELAGRPTAPAVAGGLVLVGSSEGGVTAYEAATGAPRWTRSTKEGVVGQPVVAEGAVYFGGGGDKILHAVSLEDGGKLWTKRVKGEGIYAPVRVEDGRIFAFSATHHAAPVLYALSTDKGKRLWQEDRLEITPVTGPNVLELSTGLLITCVTPDRYRKKADVTEDGEATGYLVAFGAESGEEEWRVKTGPLACSGPTVSGEVVVCYGRPLSAGPPTAPSELHLLAFSTRDGEELWRKVLGPAPPRWASTSAVIAGGNAIAASASGVNALDLESGEERWANPARSAVVTAAGGVVYLAAMGGPITAVDASTGEPMWRTTLRPLEAPPPGPACPGEIAPPSLAD